MQPGMHALDPSVTSPHCAWAVPLGSHPQTCGEPPGAHLTQRSCWASEKWHALVEAVHHPVVHLLRPQAKIQELRESGVQLLGDTNNNGLFRVRTHQFWARGWRRLLSGP